MSSVIKYLQNKAGYASPICVECYDPDLDVCGTVLMSTPTNNAH